MSSTAKRPIFVLSGVNRGRNAGEDVIYSGTVAGAVEGTLIGVPSLALSQVLCRAQRARRPIGTPAANTRRRSFAACIAEGIPRDVLINVNFPDCPPDDVRRIAVTAQGRRGGQERLHIEQRKDGRGNPYYWIAYVRHGYMKAPEGTDLAALEDQLHCGDAVAARHDRRALHDQARRTVRVKRRLRVNQRRGQLRATGAAASIACASASTWNGFSSVGVCR